MTEELMEAKIAEAANASAVAQQAQLQAIEQLHINIGEIVRDTIRSEMSPDKGKYIDVSRVPLICQAIISMSSDMKEIKENTVTQDQFWPVKMLVYGAAVICLVALLGTVIIHAIPGAPISIP